MPLRNKAFSLHNGANLFLESDLLIGNDVHKKSAEAISSHTLTFLKYLINDTDIDITLLENVTLYSNYVANQSKKCSSIKPIYFVEFM